MKDNYRNRSNNRVTMDIVGINNIFNRLFIRILNVVVTAAE